MPYYDDLPTIAGHKVMPWGSVEKQVVDVPHPDGRPPTSGGYIVAMVSAVHVHGCPITRFGKRHGPCTCGTEEAWKRWIAAQGDRDPFAGIVGPDGAGEADRPRELAERILELSDEGVDSSASAVELAGWVLTSSVTVARQERDLRRADAARHLAASEEGA